MIYARHLLSALLMAVCASTTTPEDPFFESLMRFSEQYQPPEASQQIQTEKTESQISHDPDSFQKPLRVHTTPLHRSRPSPLSQVNVISFQKSVEFRPFRSKKLVHTKYFFLPKQTEPESTEKTWTWHAALGENTTSVEHILIDHEFLINVFCSHTSHDFVSKEPQVGKFALVNTKIKPYQHPHKDLHSSSLFFPSASSFSYGSKLVARIAYLVLCVLVHLIFSAS